MNISVKAFENADPDSAVKAHVNMTIDNAFVVKNLSVVQGKNGLFVNMPHHKSSEVGEGGKAVYHDDAFPLTKGLRDKIQEAAIESYEKGGDEVSFDYDSVQQLDRSQPKASKTDAGRESVRQNGQGGKPSVLKILADKEPAPKGTDRPIKLSMAEPKKGKGEAVI